MLLEFTFFIKQSVLFPFFEYRLETPPYKQLSEQKLRKGDEPQPS